MLRQLASLRLWLVAAMTAAAITGLIAARFIIAGIENRNEHVKDRRKAELVAASIAAQMGASDPTGWLRRMQSVLPTDGIVVYRGDRLLFAGHAGPHDELELSVSRPFPGGRVVLRDYESARLESPASAWSVTLVSAGVVVLVIIAAAATATLLVRTIRRPVERAVGAARRVAAGDFGARIGGGGPEELVELGRSFDEMAGRLEAADRDQRRFLADVTHEIATPINIITGYALALADDELDDPRELHEASEVVHSETERLRSLLDKLRELTQLDLVQRGATERVAIERVLAGLQTRFAPTATAAGVTLRVHGGGTIEGDLRLLETVLDNLVSNAIRYTPAGGEVRVSTHRQRQTLTVSVRDSGIGIPPEHQRRIFDRFYRVSEARDRVSGGTGIGLALAQRAARGLGGHIELESSPGHGSEFRLVLPRAGSPAAGGASETADAVTP